VPLLRVLLHAVIIMAGLHLLRFTAQAVHAPVLLALLNYLAAGWFIILGLVASSAMHNQKALVLTISILVPLGAAPFHDMDSFAHTIVPIGAGILLGTALRPAVREWTDHDRTSSQPLHRDQ